ncbi:MAG: hypothetical protein ACR2RL_10480 [Gammaproteobacteria bacterium]
MDDSAPLLAQHAPVRSLEARPDGTGDRDGAKPGAGPDSGPGQTPTVGPTVGDVYLDQTLEPEGLGEDLDDIEPEEDDVIGRRFLSYEYRLFREDSSDGIASLEQGIGVRWSRETLDYGTLSFDGEARHEAEEGFAVDTGGLRFALGQDGFALNETWLADSTLGDSRATTDRDVSSSFRFTLPSSILRGATTRIYSDESEFRFSAGQVGRYSGVASLSFEDSGGFLWGLGASHDLGENWSLGVQGWTLSDDGTIEDHTSLAGVVQYDDREGPGRLQLRALQDSEGNLGVWFDGDTLVSRWRHRYGVFRFEPDLLWTDVQVVDDRQGFYWRGDRRSFRRSWSLGVDFEQTNIESDPGVSGTNTGRAFLNLGWRLKRRTSVGGFANVQFQGPASGIDSDSTQAYSLSGFVNHQFPVGTTRLQADVDGIRGGGDSSTGYGLTWDQEWKQGFLDRLDTTVAWNQVYGELGDSNTLTLGASIRHDITPALTMFGNAAYVVSNSNDVGDNDASNLNLGVFWQLSRYWQVDLTATLNENVVDPVNEDEFRRTGHRILLTLRHSRARGRAPQIFGRRSDKTGTGRIAGRVFLDENRDGKWSTNEQGVEGIVVYLDRRGTPGTSVDGTFEITPVFVGEHDVTIGLEDVPLPWGLDDETPRKVTVGLRERIEIDFPLIRLDE